MTRDRLPPWLRNISITHPDTHHIRRLLRRHALHSVCEEARCPNRGECFSRQTATFMILGERCTRNCGFCAVSTNPVQPPDPEEPERLAAAVREMGLRYVVVTSVTRDDLPDGGAAHFAATIRAIRDASPGSLIEVLVPDFQGDEIALREVLRAEPDVLNHNVETVPRLYPVVRPQADYQRSLMVLQRARSFSGKIPVKSGLMVGLGEETAEVIHVLQDLYGHGCRVVTIGQYLQPTRHNLPVQRYLPPEEFEEFERQGRAIGLTAVFAGPLVRSSYSAESLFAKIQE
ncbi:MAG: lipoyl synthase [Acidobacteria bacterium]|nr:lipoyl synthase [Acidobacteriota bacterium]